MATSCCCEGAWRSSVAADCGRTASREAGMSDDAIVRGDSV